MLLCLPEGKRKPPAACPYQLGGAKDLAENRTSRASRPSQILSSLNGAYYMFNYKLPVTNYLEAKRKTLRGITNYEHRESNFSSL